MRSAEIDAWTEGEEEDFVDLATGLEAPGKNSKTQEDLKKKATRKEEPSHPSDRKIEKLKKESATDAKTHSLPRNESADGYSKDYRNLTIYNQQRRSMEDWISGMKPKNHRNIHIYTTEEVKALHSDDKRRHFPHCLVIGVRKGGTSALRDFIALHPDIKAPRSEPGFFFNDITYQKGLEYYRSCLPPTKKNQISIEKSAEYFTSPNVPERVHAFNSSIKLILIVRDPFRRTVSDYMFLQRYNRKDWCVEKQYSFEDLVYNETTGRINTKWGCLKRSVYFYWYQEWLKFFPRKQIMVIDGDTFMKNNPGRELTKVEKFLGIQPLLDKSRFYLNETKGFYCVKDLGCLQETKGHQPFVVSPELETKIRDYFRPYNQEFYELTGHDFGWK